MRGFRFVLAVL